MVVHLVFSASRSIMLGALLCVQVSLVPFTSYIVVPELRALSCLAPGLYGWVQVVDKYKQYC